MPARRRKNVDPNRHRPVLVHPVVHTRLRDIASREDCSIPEAAHNVLCRGLGLDPLLVQTQPHSQPAA